MGNNPEKAQSGVIKFFLWLPAPRMGKEVVGSYVSCSRWREARDGNERERKGCRPKERVLRRFTGICIPHSNQDTGMLLLSFATPAAYDAKHQNKRASFLAHCSTSLLPRISLGRRQWSALLQIFCVIMEVCGMETGQPLKQQCPIKLNRTFCDHGNVLSLVST